MKERKKRREEGGGGGRGDRKEKRNKERGISFFRQTDTQNTKSENQKFKIKVSLPEINIMGADKNVQTTMALAIISTATLYFEA